MLRHLILLLIALATTLQLPAQRLLKKPLSYIPADSIIILPSTDHNIMSDIMAVNFHLNPHPFTLDKGERKQAKRSIRGKHSDNDSLCIAPEKMFLLTGHSSYFDSLEQEYVTLLPAILHSDELHSYPYIEAAAQRLLNLTGTIIASDRQRDIYVNILENCTSRVNTGKVRFLLDMIYDLNLSPIVKFRISGMQNNGESFTLHIRIPSWASPKRFYICGHEIVSPLIVDGYLVVERQWRNNEEIFFYVDR